MCKCDRFENYGNILVSASIVKKVAFLIFHRGGSEKCISVTSERYIVVHFKEKLWRKKHQNRVVYMDEVAPITARELVEAIADKNKAAFSVHRVVWAP